MFRGLFEGWHPILLILIVVLVFGANRLPGAARNIAQSLKIFRRELESGDDRPSSPAAGSAPGTPPVPPAPTPAPTSAPTSAPATTTPQQPGQPGATGPTTGPDVPPSTGGGTAAQV